MNILAFDVHGDFGHFRKFYTTTSPLTFSAMPPTAIYGLLGAILGLSHEQNDYLRVLNAQTVKAAVQLLRPVRKTMIGINYINTKESFWAMKKNPRTQIRMEVLRDPGYRLYVHLQDQTLHRELADKVKAHESVYTPCLGLSEMIADIRYYGEGEAQPVPLSEGAFFEVRTLIPTTAIHPRSIQLKPGLHLLKEKMPLQMNTDREVSRYETVIFDSAGQAVPLSASQVYRFDFDGAGIVFCNEV